MYEITIAVSISDGNERFVYLLTHHHHADWKPNIFLSNLNTFDLDDCIASICQIEWKDEFGIQQKFIKY